MNYNPQIMSQTLSHAASGMLIALAAFAACIFGCYMLDRWFSGGRASRIG